MKIAKVDTPQSLHPASLSYDAITATIRQEFKRHDKWTDTCTSALQSSPHMLFCYDRLEYASAKAFGDNKLKIMLNPLMVMCYHPACISSNKPPVRLKKACSLQPYLLHLLSHGDVIGKCMLDRFTAMDEDLFHDDYKDISPSPFSLMDPFPAMSDKSFGYLKQFAIKRDFNILYICHWKNIFISNGVISSQSLSFQEDDALLYMSLKFPQPVVNWAFWKTLSFYSLKLFSSISTTAVNLYRGITSYENLDKSHEVKDIKQFTKEINHPSASVTTLQRWTPSILYTNDQFHRHHLLFHIKIVTLDPNSICLNFDGVSRYPAVLLIDEQELNQGTFVHNGVLHGLQKKLTATDISRIGISQLPRYIASDSPFVSSVREYRLTDLCGSFCSNVYTSFLTAMLNTSDCINSLSKVAQLASTCEACLKNHSDCDYESLQTQCSFCREKNIPCVSLCVFHVMWDMGSSHKKAEKTIDKITEISTETEYDQRKLFTIGFGGLHLAKCFTNCLRNHSLTLHGQNFGLHMLRALRSYPGAHTDCLSNVKTAVFVGKDRQSDYISYMLSSKPVQEALILAESCVSTRVPEPVLSFTDNAKQQKKVLMPSGILCNRNGDIFVLDSGGCCVHVLDRSSVAKVYIIGEYMHASSEKYSMMTSLTATKITFSNFLCDIFRLEDDIFIVDGGRGEVVIIRKCIVAKSISSCYVNIVQKSDVRSITILKENLICLCKKTSGDVVEIIDLNLPAAKKGMELYVSAKPKRKLNMSESIKCIFSVEKPCILGLVSEKSEIILTELSSERENIEYTTLKSVLKPVVHDSSTITIMPPTRSVLQEVVFSCETFSLNDVNLKEVDLASVCHISRHGKIICFISKDKDLNGYKVCEYNCLDYGLELLRGINYFYGSISYLPPHGIKSSPCKKSLPECIKLSEPLVTVLNNMQQECKTRFPSRNSFLGAFGTVFTDTLYCLNSTVNSWKAISHRLNYFNKDALENVDSHTVTNEAKIERSFGFTNKKGQAQLQNQSEYSLAKNKQEMDFQLRMADLPFNQYVKIKLRDKGYQHVNENMKSTISLKDLWSIVFSKREKEINEEIVVVTENEAKVLYQAFLVTKAVPRRSNRAKWKDESGYAPNMLRNTVEDGTLKKGDLVFARNFSDHVVKLIVEADKPLLDINDRVPVRNVADGTCDSVVISSLITDKGLVAVVPSTLYTTDGNNITLSDAANQMLAEVLCEGNAIYNDEELCELPAADMQCTSTSAEKRASEDEHTSNRGSCSPPIKRTKTMSKRIVSEDSSSSESEEEADDENVLSVDNYCVVVYEGCMFPGKIIRCNVDGGAQVNVMCPTADGWIWPKAKDQVDYKRKNILRKYVKAPYQVNNGVGRYRGVWKFEKSIEDLLVQINQL